MKKSAFILIIVTLLLLSFKKYNSGNDYIDLYSNRIGNFESKLKELQGVINARELTNAADINKIRDEINSCRLELKGIDIWLRYLEPISYKRINGPLPVEWETEVFEKFEKPYKREGAGLTLASLYLDEEKKHKDSLSKLINYSLIAIQTYKQDSITKYLKTFDHFYLCNRLFLLNLATIYTTGFECPETDNVIKELESMLLSVGKIYSSYNLFFPNKPLPNSYLNSYERCINFVKAQSKDFEVFDHFSFVKDHINPLFSINQQLINEYQVKSNSYVDYSLTKEASSIFSKQLFVGQNTKGIFQNIKDEKVLGEIERIGKLLFYDPILSGNNLRSCVSCHAPSHFFTDTIQSAALQFDKKESLQRNTPSLLNSTFNHLIMHDGLHFNLQDQAKAVITSSVEMGSTEKDVVEKVMSCEEYKTIFEGLLKYTPQEKTVTIDHIASALTLYYGKFSMFESPFDIAMNNKKETSISAKKGYNLFMSKAQCATCHFAPQFNGVKPPYVGSEFEVLGVPKDTNYKALSDDKGRYFINPAKETANAFRTGTVRNAEKTKPYMHNGIFKTMNQLIDFYDGGGGAGRGLNVPNQTLSSDSLHLTNEEKINLISFISSLNEEIEFDKTPNKLPISKKKKLNSRKPGGDY